jgi:hypothetical protein
VNVVKVNGAEINLLNRGDFAPNAYFGENKASRAACKFSKPSTEGLEMHPASRGFCVSVSKGLGE